MKLHINEDYEDDMIAYNQAMADYKQAKADYDIQMQDYYAALKDYDTSYSVWNAGTKSGVAKKVTTDCNNAVKKYLNNEQIRWASMLWDCDSRLVNGKLPCEIHYTLLDGDNASNSEPNYINLDNETLEKVELFLRQYLEKLPNVTDVNTNIWDKFGGSYTVYHVDCYFKLTIGKNPNKRPVKPVKPVEPVKPIKPTPPKNPNADYEVYRKYHYCDDSEIEILFGFDNESNIEQKLKQAGWLAGGYVYIPKGTQFVMGPDLWPGGHLYETIKIVGGPMDGVLVPFLSEDDDLCVDTFIRRHCKHI